MWHVQYIHRYLMIFMYMYNHIQRSFLIHTACPMFTFQLESQIGLVFSFRSAWMLQGWHASMQQTHQSWSLRNGWLVCAGRHVWQLVDLKPLRYCPVVSFYVHVWCDLKMPKFANYNLFATWFFKGRWWEWGHVEGCWPGQWPGSCRVSWSPWPCDVWFHIMTDKIRSTAATWHVAAVLIGFQAANPYKCRSGWAPKCTGNDWNDKVSQELKWHGCLNDTASRIHFFSILIYTYLIYIDEHHEHSYRLAHCKCMCISFDFVIALQRLILNFIHFAIANGHRHMFPQASGKPGFLSPVPKSVQSESHERKTARLQEVHCAGTSRHWSSSPDICIS